MARARTLRVRTVRTRDERRRPSVYLRLKAEESFRGYALFEPDPELKDNVGYFEYYDHFDKQGNTYVPCAGEDCPFCAVNDNPSTRALTAWFFPDAGDKKDEIKLFTMNFSTVEEMADEAEEEDGTLGKKVRVRRMDDRGNYKVRILPDKPLTKTQLAAAMKRLEDEILKGNGLEGLVMAQLKRQIERLKAIDALEDDEYEEEETEKPKARRGKEVSKADEEEAEEETEEEAEDEEGEEDEEEEGEEESEDEDEEEAEDEADEEEEGDEEELVDAEYEIVRIQRQDEIFDLVDGDGNKERMWLGDSLTVDYDEIKKGDRVVVSAIKDEEEDWILVKIEKVQPKRTTARKRPTTRRSSK